MKRIFALLLVLTLALCSCGGGGATSSEETPYPVTVREITLLKKPEKVVSLSPWLTSTINQLGFSQTLAGISDFCTASTAPKMGTAENPDIELIVKAQPDFVLVSQELSESGREWLSKNNIPFYTIEKPETFNELVGLYSDIITIFEGKTDGLKKGQELASKLIDRAGKMKAILEKEPQTFLYVQPDGFYLTGETLVSDIMKTIGLVNVAEAMTDYYIDADTLKSLEPTVIFVDKSVDIEEFSKTSPFDKMTDNIVALDMNEILKLKPDVLDNFLELVGGEEAITPPAPSTLPETSGEAQ